MKFDFNLFLIGLFFACVTSVSQAVEVVELDDVHLQQNILDRWENVSQMSVGPKTQQYVEEGRLIMARYEELVALEKNADPSDTEDLKIEISKMKLSLLNLLRKIEDVSLFDLSTQELLDLRNKYVQERELLEGQKSTLRDTILNKGEVFLQDYRRNTEMRKFNQGDVVAKLCLRLGELYYEKTEESFYSRMDQLVEEFEAGAISPGDEPVRNYDDAVHKYQKIIDEYPFSDYMDDALYNIAYIRENSPDPIEVEESRRLYEQIVRDYSSSRFAAESWMRLGEYWFRKASEESIDKAIQCYEMVLGYDEFTKREKALYKLGWCHFRLQNYNESVDAFTQSAKFSHNKIVSGEPLGADLLDESIAYIAVNYAVDEWANGNIGQLAAYVRNDLEIKQGIGFKLMLRYGDLLKNEVQDFPAAVAAYDSLLVMYPYSMQAPFIQEKIVACYGKGALNDPEMAYIEKNELFEHYSVGGSWEPEEPEADREKVDIILEQHLEENVRIALLRSNASSLPEDQEEYVELSRKYIQAYPADTAAFGIHWNMAVTIQKSIGDKQTALDEYMAISLAYPTRTTEIAPERNIRNAAYNAVILAQQLVDEEMASPDVEPELDMEPEDSSESVVEDLTAMEEQKRSTMLSFIELFPADALAPQYLLSAGLMYYNHANFAAAAGDFDLIIDKYQGSAEFEDAYKYKLEGLYAEGRFAEAEDVALKIQELELSADLVNAARGRQAEAVYSAANELRGQENHLEAAEEFRRMALDVPDAEFAHASLNDAAFEFNLAGEFEQAAQTYLYLAEHYPLSEYADAAVFLAARIYLEEMNDYARGAVTFEQLASDYPDSEYAVDAILNSSYCYEKEDDWNSTIRMNSLYVQRYPTAADANRILFSNAGLYLKLNDVESANSIYQDFARQYPNDPATVQAFVERADYFLRTGDIATARDEYNNALQRHRNLVAQTGNGNSIYAGKASRKLIEWDYASYADLDLRQPAAQLNSDKLEKQRLLENLLTDLGELIDIGGAEVFYARYMQAMVLEETARAYREQERPDYPSIEQRVNSEITIQNEAHSISMEAVESFINTNGQLESAFVNLEKTKLTLENRRNSLRDYIARLQADAAPANEDSLGQLTILSRNIDNLDSTLIDGRIWTGRSREMVPEIVQADLEQYSKRVELSVMRHSSKRDPFNMLADQNANFLQAVSLPLLQLVVEAYDQGLQTISRVGLERLWRPRLEKQLAEVIWFMPAAYRDFRHEAYSYVEQSANQLAEIITKGEDYEDARGNSAEIYGGELVDMADINSEYARSSILIYDTIIGLLQTNNIAPQIVLDLSDSLAVESLRASAELDVQAAELLSTKNEFWSQYEQTSSYLYSDGSAFMDDSQYYLTVTSKELLLEGEAIVSEINPGSIPARRLLFQLAQIEPARFGEKFGLQEEEIVFGSSSDWLCNDIYIEGFELAETADLDWKNATAKSNPALDFPEVAETVWFPIEDLSPVEISPDTMLLSALDISGYKVIEMLDTLGTGNEADQLLYQVIASELPDPQLLLDAQADTVFFRYKFNLSGTPVGAKVEFSADEAFYLFFNGEFIDEARPEAGFVTENRSWILDDFVKAGDNILAVEVQDQDRSGGGMRCSITVRQTARLTEELFEEQLAKEVLKQQKLLLEREVNRTYDKNRVN
jgi:TolA-binding protein